MAAVGDLIAGPVPLAPPASAAPAPEGAWAGEPGTARPEVLVVDDEPAVVSLLIACLTRAGYSATGVGSPSEAMELLRTRRFDLVLCDLRMPEMSGLEMIAKARMDVPDLAVIVITGVLEVDTGIRAMRMGAYDYVVKPFSPGDVVLRVSSALETRRSVMQARRSQESLRDAYSRLQQMAEVKDSLVHMLVHDLKAPLGSAMGYLEMVQRKVGSSFPERQLRYLEHAYGSCRDVLRMATTILDVTRFERGALELNRTVIDLPGILQEAKTETEGLIAGSGGRVAVSCHPGATHARADAEIVRRVLSNLLSNAVKHTPPGTNVSVTAEPDGEGSVIVSVVDQGRGIPVEHQGRIFEKFHQLDPGSASAGAGLGLAFCKMAVEAHGGRIWVESAPGRGSAFRFSLPQAGPTGAPGPQTQEGERL